MLGGDHIGPAPEEVADQVVRCRYTIRSHCYALRGAALWQVYRAYQTGNGYGDHILAEQMATLRFYAPASFLVAQAGGWSDIDGHQWPSRFAP